MTFRNNTDLARLLVINVSENDTTSTSNKEISINRVLGKSSYWSTTTVCQLCYWISNWNKTNQNWKQKECVLKVNIKLEKCKWKQKKFRF